MAKFVSPITNLVIRVWDCSKQHINVLCQAKENLDTLRDEMRQLKDIRIDVNVKVATAEAQQMVPTHAVKRWLQSVEVKEGEVDAILQEGSEQIERRCFSACCPQNCCLSYKLGKKITKELALVEKLKSQGDFQVVAEKLLPPPVQAILENPTEGLDATFDKVWSLLEDNEIKIMGIYGQGGVGKTTLLRKINNAFLNKTGVFDVIIWVVISSDVHLERVQKDIGERLGLPWPEIKDQNSGASDIYDALIKKKFVILLDDLWERLDLSIIGIPPPYSSEMSKVVFTTRSEQVCGRMEADRKIKVECLIWEQSWTLFQKNVGHEALNSDPEISKLAELVAKECDGLPMALIAIGRAMAGRKTPQEWKHAITVLQKTVGEFPGMGDQVLPLLKFSYESLPDDTTRSCFLFCSLYPEDFQIPIEKLIEQWIGEGYIEGYHDYEEASYTGHHIIRTLKSTCLLETGEEDSNVKMHDVIRELALWIGCDCGKTQEKVLGKSGHGLTEAPKTEKWSKAETISLIGTGITQLDDIPKTPNLTTLLLFRNFQLTHISNDFFIHMPALRVLDLSDTPITSLPTSIGECVGLEFLDLSSTKIRELPCEIMKLEKLKYLSLMFNIQDIKIPHGVIKHLSNLQILKQNFSPGDPDEDLQGGIDELDSLHRLIQLEIKISSFHVLQMFLNNKRLASCTRFLCIHKCEDEVTSHTLSLSASGLSLGYMNMLRRLEIYDCQKLKILEIDCLAEDYVEIGLFKSLEAMVLLNLPDLIISWDKGNLHHPCFTNLSYIWLNECHSLAHLTWLLLVPNIKYLTVSSCNGIREIISDEFGAHHANTFTKLIRLRLWELPNLRSIFKNPLHFPSLGEIHVFKCPSLTRLPLDSNSAHNTLKFIRGFLEWWNNLEWDDETVEDTFSPFFRKY